MTPLGLDDFRHPRGAWSGWYCPSIGADDREVPCDEGKSLFPWRLSECVFMQATISLPQVVFLSLHSAGTELMWICTDLGCCVPESAVRSCRKEQSLRCRWSWNDKPCPTQCFPFSAANFLSISFDHDFQNQTQKFVDNKTPLDDTVWYTCSSFFIHHSKCLISESMAIVQMWFWESSDFKSNASMPINISTCGLLHKIPSFAGPLSMVPQNALALSCHICIDFVILSCCALSRGNNGCVNRQHTPVLPTTNSTHRRIYFDCTRSHTCTKIKDQIDSRSNPKGMKSPETVWNLGLMKHHQSRSTNTWKQVISKKLWMQQRDHLCCDCQRNVTLRRMVALEIGELLILMWNPLCVVFPWRRSISIHAQSRSI